jgi:hypothetical protein
METSGPRESHACGRRKRQTSSPPISVSAPNVTADIDGTIALHVSDMSDAEKDAIVATATGNARVTFVDLGDGEWF